VCLYVFVCLFVCAFMSVPSFMLTRFRLIDTARSTGMPSRAMCTDKLLLGLCLSYVGYVDVWKHAYNNA